ncbi:MAG: sensor histidine kinase [Chloroflexi bacterium]|nr:sensor histidine kinase [Chloroflexota bacterium]
MKETAAVRPSRAGDLALVALALGLAVATALIVTLPAVVPGIVNDRLDIGITMASLLVSVAVAALNGARGRVAGDAGAVLRGSAFWVLAALNLLIFAVQIPGAEASFGASLEAPGQLPVIATIVARGAAAILLIGAGIVALREPSPLARPGWVLAAPAILVGLVIAAAAAVQDQLPAVIDPATLAELARNPTAALRPGAAPWLVTMQATLGVGFLVAALLAHRAWRSNGRIGQLLLSAGLLIAAFSQVHTAMHPGSFVSLVTTGDLLRLAFYIVLLIGFVIDSRDDLRALRRANVQLQRLSEAELAGAALEERARLAREIHDGLAQDLWYAKLKQSRLAQTADLGGEALALSHEVADAIDSALAEARNAVAAMREGVEAGSLLEMISRHVDDFSDRFAIRAEITQSGRPPDVGPRAQAEVLRIVQEALTNVRKHADATVVRVDVASDGELRLVIADNGRGFRTESAPPGFGLESMRQRAELIGARLTVTSEPQNGTRVEVHVPLRQREEKGDG